MTCPVPTVIKDTFSFSFKLSYFNYFHFSNKKKFVMKLLLLTFDNFSFKNIVDSAEALKI